SSTSYSASRRCFRSTPKSNWLGRYWIQRSTTGRNTANPIPTKQAPGARHRHSRCCAAPGANGGGRDRRRRCGRSREGAAPMIVELPGTSTTEINKKLNELRE